MAAGHERSGPSFTTAYVALGGNVGDVKSALVSARDHLSDEPIIRVASVSNIYRTAAVGGPAGQRDYLNAVIGLETTLSAQEILNRCLEIERALGRVRDERWGPRTIDLDLLLYGEVVIDDVGLCVPHPRLRERLFVLAPLRDIAPGTLPVPPDGERLDFVISRACDLEGTSLVNYRKICDARPF